MTGHDLFAALAHTVLSRWLNASTWAFAVTEMVHLLALAVLGGAVIAVDLRVLGFGLRVPPWRVASELRRPLSIAVAVLILSGTVLLLTDPLKYYVNVAFRIKIVLLALAIVVSVILHRRLLRQRTVAVGPASRALAAASLVAWFGIGLCGRLIGLI